MQLPPARTPARRRLVVLAVLAVLALIVGIAVGAGSGDDEASRAPAPEPATRDTPERPRAEAVGAAEKLSLRRQVGQLIVMRFNGPGPPAYVPQALRGGRAAGVILFKDNVESRPALKRLVAKLQRGARGSALVATDQEGGEIRNLTWARPVEGQAAAATRAARPRRRPRRRARPPRRGGQRQPRAGRGRRVGRRLGDERARVPRRRRAGRGAHARGGRGLPRHARGGDGQALPGAGRGEREHRRHVGQPHAHAAAAASARTCRRSAPRSPRACRW